MAEPIILTRTLQLPHDQQNRQIEIPFEMPAGSARLEVSYQFEALGPGESVLDIGCLEGDTLRGWTGSARREFFIATAAATPGYRPGPLGAGRWSLLVGTYKVPPDGMTASVEIRIYPGQPVWLRGDLHHHTHHSDGSHSVAEVLAMAEQAGLDFLALTDHNTVTQNRFICESPVLAIPGLEVTTNHGHLNLLGAVGPVDFRFASARAGLTTPVAEVRAAGGIAILNHPHCDSCPWEMEWDFDFDAVEVWNGIWLARNQRAVDWWQQQLAAGRRLPAVGGSDTHTVGLLSVLRTGTPTTYVRAEDRSVPAILAALKAGRSIISDSPDGPVPWLSAGDALPGGSVGPGERLVRVRVERGGDCLLRLIGPGGVLAETGPEGIGDGGDWEWEYNWAAAPGSFLRVELWSTLTGWLRALTNPIWCDEDVAETRKSGA